MNYGKQSSTIKKCVILLLVLTFAKITIAQDAREYYPLHVGDYWIQQVDSLEGEPGIMRMDVEDIDIIRGQSYFRMKQQLTNEATGEEYTTWYVWMKEDTSGILIGAFGDSSEVTELVIASRTITVDGIATDWSGIAVLATDPQGDDSPSFAGDDIKALYIARDATNLFIRMDLWDNANLNFQNSPPPYDGRYSIFIDNIGPYPYMELGIAYDSYAAQWSLGYNGSSSDVPLGLAGPNFVGVSGNIIELKIPLNLIGNPSQYNKINGEVHFQYDSQGDELQVKATFLYDPPIRWIHSDMLKAGFSWEFDAPEMGGHHWITLESNAETVQVPAGTFYNCVKLKQIIVNSEGDTIQNQDVYYARGVGEVLKLGWSDWMGRMDFRLIDYSIQSIQVEPVNQPQAGQNFNLTIVSSSQNFVPTTKRLYYRSTGESNWQYLNITAPGANFNVTVPQNIMTLRGVEYYVYLSDGQQEVTYPAIDPEIKPARIQVAVSNYTPSLALHGMTYQMISVPLELTNPQVQNVLGDDYGQYNPEQWRLFRWEDGDYVEYPDITASFTPGAAFWLVTRDSESFDVDNGISTDSSQPFSCTLLPGWNQVANPFAFPILSDTVDVPEDMLDPPVYYDGTEYQYDVPILQPWQGYFVYNKSNSPVTIFIPPIAAQGGVPKLSKLLTINTESEYMLQLSVTMQNTRLMDTQNYIGSRSNATDARDDFDLVEAPPIGEYIQLSIIENEERFAANFKPALTPGNQWEMELSVSPLIELPVHINLLETGKLQEGQQLYILDKDFDCAIATTEKNFSVKISREMPVRHFKVLVGTKEYAEQNSQGISLIPLDYRLDQNFPNPFNPETIIPYQLGRRSMVSLEIYNILGQRIRTLIHDVQNTGQYAVTWDGRNDEGKLVAAGIYMCHFQADEFAATRKLILVR
jgi:hypothetical protein